MATPYEAPSVTVIGSLRDLTMLDKDLTGIDGVNLIIPALPPIGLGPVS